jgi:proline iminopeptidase
VVELDTSLGTNTTEHLIGDIEKLREHLGIDRWLVWGGSWGVTLGLAYAEHYPGRVTEMVLVSCTMTRPGDVHWLYHEAGRFFPARWQRYSDGGGNAEDLVAVGGRLDSSERYTDPRFRMIFARLCAHYFSHAAWLEDGQLLRDIGQLAGIPGVLNHGHFDIGGPPDVPWLLHQAWPGAELHLVWTGIRAGIR